MVHLNKILNSGLFGMDEKIEDSTVKEIILDETFIKVNRYKREMVNEEYQSNHEWLNSREYRKAYLFLLLSAVS
jgi:hypothetical protein